jgi:hypothetical protein
MQQASLRPSCRCCSFIKHRTANAQKRAGRNKKARRVSASGLHSTN